MAETKRPPIPPPVSAGSGKISVIVSGKVTVKSTSPNVKIERRD
jgi:hypothetical protein